MRKPPRTLAEYLERRGIRGTIASGVLFLDATEARRLRLAPWLCRFLDEHGPAVVVPLRGPDNKILAIHVRAIGGKARRTRGVLHHRGAPVAYGFPGAALRAEVLVVVEGMADTWVAEGLTAHDPRIVIVGAHGADDLVRWARWLAPRWNAPDVLGRLRPPPGPGRRVVLCPHLDAGDAADGTGIERAAEAADILDAAGIAWRDLPWGSLLTRVGLRHLPGEIGSLDLADLAPRVAWADLRAAFLDALGLDDEQPPTAPAEVAELSEEAFPW